MEKLLSLCVLGALKRRLADETQEIIRQCVRSYSSVYTHYLAESESWYSRFRL